MVFKMGHKQLTTHVTTLEWFVADQVGNNTSQYYVVIS